MTKRNYRRLPLQTLAIAALLGCSMAGRGSETSEQRIDVNGVPRSYIIHLPGSYRDRRGPVPLVILLHGHGSTGVKIERSTGMSGKADEEGFIAVYPQGRGSPASWQVFADASGNNEDVVFIGQLIDTLKKLYAVDPSRVYVAGHSNGAMLAYRLGVTLADRIAGVGVSAGLLGEEFARDTVAATPVTLVAFHGKSDTIVPYGGGGGGRSYRRGFLSSPASVEVYAKRNACEGAAETSRSNGNVTEKIYTGCRGHSAVVFLTINDLTHKWPGDLHGFFRRSDHAEESATNRMWEVFRDHPKQ